MTPPPGLGSTVEEKPGTGVRIAPPSVFRGDRKAGAGEGQERVESMARIAQAIQHQTAKLATLVRHQAETSTQPSGTLKGLGKAAEELVFVLRACGQYEVGLGAGEHGQALANALIAAQVGASSKLRAAGFRQKMTQRGFWGTHEKHCLGASEFITFTDAELDAFSSEARGSRGAGDARPPMPQRLDEWLVRVKRQTDVWCLVYGAEWRAVRSNAMEKLAEWYLASPHRWPLTVIMDIWEELHWRLIEEVKIVRLLKKETTTGRRSLWQRSDFTRSYLDPMVKRG